MENNVEKKELEPNAKKEWVSPEIHELNLNGGSFKWTQEDALYNS